MLNPKVNTCNLRNFQEFVTDRKKNILYGLGTPTYQYPQLLSLLSKTFKESNYLSQF